MRFCLVLAVSTILLVLLVSDINYLNAWCPSGGSVRPSGPTPGTPVPIQPPTNAPKQIQPPPPSVPRPPLGPGLQPLIQSIQLGSISLSSVAEPWEVWWSRNRNSYLNFRKQTEWLKIVDEGGTRSVSEYPEYKELIKILEEEVSDKDHYVAFRAAIALGKVQDSQNPKSINTEVIKILKKANEAETRYFVKNNILLALGLSGDPSVASIITEVFKNKKEPALRRSYAGIALGYINSPEVIQVLKDVIIDKDENEVRCSAAMSLGNLKETSAVTLLGKILNPPEGVQKGSALLRAYASLGLGRIGGKDALAELKKCAASNEKENDVRTAVVTALGLTGLAEARDSIMNFTQDRNSVIRGLATISFAQIKDVKAYEIISELIKKNKETEADGLMLIALGITGNQKAKADLIKILENKKSRSLLKAASAIALGLLKDTEAVLAITNILKDEKLQKDVILTPYLILSLGMIQDVKGTEVLTKMWDKIDKNLSQIAYTNLAVVLSMLDRKEEVLAKIIDQINPKDVTLSTYALHTLGLIGNRTAAKAFIDVNKDNLEIRKATMVGIGFLLDRNATNPIDIVTSNNIDTPMLIMEHILPIPVW